MYILLQQQKSTSTDWDQPLSVISQLTKLYRKDWHFDFNVRYHVVLIKRVSMKKVEVIVYVFCNFATVPRNNVNIGNNLSIQGLTMFKSKLYVPETRPFQNTHKSTRFTLFYRTCFVTPVLRWRRDYQILSLQRSDSPPDKQNISLPPSFQLFSHLF